MKMLHENQFLMVDVDSLFHRRRFFELHDQGDGVCFEWGEAADIQSRICFSPLADGIWRSPLRGTFGGFYSASRLRLDRLFDFYRAVETRLRDKGARQVEVLLAPTAHAPSTVADQFYLFESSGYSVTQCDLNYGLLVTTDAFDTRMSYGNRKRLKKCLRDGLTSAACLPYEQLPLVYDTLAKNRASKGYPLSMSLEQIRQMGESFPTLMPLFGVWDGDTLAAAALCLRISNNVLYVFYWGDLPGYATSSPVVLLADAIYGYCQKNEIRYLDVGTSTVGKQPNFGLVNFKEGLGFDSSLKFRMVKEL